MPKISNPTPIESYKHKDKRANIPTEELRDLVKDHSQSARPLAGREIELLEGE